MPGGALVPPDAVPLRSLRERLVQTCCYEALGVLAVAPLVSLALGATFSESVLLLVALAGVVAVWGAFFNRTFDRIEARLAQRVSSDRPTHWRLAHAAMLEVSSVVVSCPVILAATDLNLLPALAADFGLSVVYTLYAFVFHRAYDALWPVRA